MSGAPFNIVIVGGGTAGWMAANLFAHHWQGRPVNVTLIESPDIGTVGVGEGSTPTLKRFFADMNIAESDWMPACHATYKVNIRFKGWSPGNGIAEYSHPFISQLDTFSERAFHVNCHQRLQGAAVETRPDKFLFNGWLAQHKLAPVCPDNFPFRIEYGYHFDSGLLGKFLRNHAIGLGVSHLINTVETVHTTASGHIDTLTLHDGAVVNGDLFVDCTGFASVLMQKTLQVPFNSFADNLFNDSAVVLPSPADASLPCETTATAMSNGWAWSIPLTHRTGNGYVFSSSHISKDAAETELRRHLSLTDSDVEARFLKMRVGQLAKHWHKNCLALGLSQGFIEPLEATALHLVQLAIEFFIEDFTAGNFTDQLQEKFNRDITARFARVRDYIVAHYKLNSRDDSDYWRENRDNMQLSHSLLQLLDVWYRKGDLPAEILRQQIQHHFGVTSWHCLLAGYGIFPPIQTPAVACSDQFTDRQLEHLFSGCLLNFKHQQEIFTFPQS